MKQVVYIAGRGHSGSTLLDLMLGGHPRLIGVGEVYSLFDPAKNFLNRPEIVKCSCGMQMDQCEFWGPVTNTLRDAHRSGRTVQDLYCLFLASFYQHFGEDAIPVDISKTDETLDVLMHLEDVEIKVILILRDVRSWTVSMRDVARRSKEFNISDLLRKYKWKAWKPWIGRLSSKFFWHWYVVNQSTQEHLAKNGLSHLQIGYEELCLYPDFMMQNISTFLGIEYSESMLTLKDTQSHVILGNRMRSQQEKRQRVGYDDRWFYQLEWMLPALLFPHIMRYNTREVYRNVRGHLWNR